ncbi:hypothetical protein [Candidatus Nitrososphaera evergladensis]|uniref:hypothetical protein n=1 Tax=Candidatus Nitrososphaera evergladensis TaxID=1459637 RepID=UPI00130DB37D|nr:hypothetical protein [Candidatus Nitrososphaera evergladensis]
MEIRRPKQKDDEVLLPEFQIAQAVPALTFDLKQIDAFFLGSRIGDILCIVGSRETLLASRLSVRALLPKRLGGLESHVLFIDGGNNSDIYQCVNFARQYGLDIKKVLEGIVVSRTFTIHQLAWLVIHELPKAIERFGSKLVIISGILTLFTQDPQVDQKEARRLLREMMIAIKRISGKALVVITADSIHGYEDIFAKLKNRIKIQNAESGIIKLFASTPYRSKEIVLPEKSLKLVKVE